MVMMVLAVRWWSCVCKRWVGEGRREAVKAGVGLSCDVVSDGFS